MLKFTNPFYYPVAVLCGGIVLIAGVRLFRLPNVVILPTAVAISTLGAALLKSQEPSEEKQAQQQLKQELQAIKLSAKTLAEKAKLLHQETQKILSDNSWDIDLVVAIEQACNYAVALPNKIDQLCQSLPKTQSLLSVSKLQQELEEVNAKISSSSELNRDKLQELANSLRRNIQLVETGQDLRHAQILNLQMLLQQSAGLLQQLQNKLSNLNLNKTQELEEIRNLSDQLNTNQANLDIYLN